MNQSSRIAKGSVVQLSPEDCGNPMFGGCFLLVDEVRTWGVIGFVQALGENGCRGGQAWYRAKWEEFEYCGEAQWVPAENPEAA